MNREDEIIAAIAERFRSRRARVGIGDDAAILSDGRVATSDLLIEGVDFTSAISPRHFGSKSLSANLSDLAAMGAAPDCFLASIACPESFLPSLPALLDGFELRAAAHGVELVGGDLSRGDRVTICITAIGTMEGVAPMLRSGAKPGDTIWISRPLGASAAGLELLRQGVLLPDDVATPDPAVNAVRRAILRHVDPEPEVELGMRLARSGLVRSCIDVSDGLSNDLIRLCTASGVGAELDGDAVPVDPALSALAGRLPQSALDYAINGGEEYALLFTSSAPRGELALAAGQELYAIGRITRGEVVLRLGGRTAPLEARGFDHFS